MNGDIQITNQTADKFKLGKKWFWIGIVVAFFHALAGLVYGITLILEKDHRREGDNYNRFCHRMGVIQLFCGRTLVA